MNMLQKVLFAILFSCLYLGCDNKVVEIPMQNLDVIMADIEEPPTQQTYIDVKNEEKGVDLNKAIKDFYEEWKHVKYRFGGTSKKGIDCSSFTQKFYKQKLKIKIPRSTAYQAKTGTKISKSQLEIGDLVFFKSRKHGRHVGIYAGNGKFLHASIKGVKFSSLDKNYYRKNYWTSRKIF